MSDKLEQLEALRDKFESQLEALNGIANDPFAKTSDILEAIKEMEETVEEMEGIGND